MGSSRMLYLDGEMVAQQRSEVNSSLPGGYLVLGGYMYANKQKSDITYHGWLGDVSMWVNLAIDVINIVCGINDLGSQSEDPYIAWNSSHILTVNHISDYSLHEKRNITRDEVIVALQVEKQNSSSFLLPLCVPTTTTMAATEPTTKLPLIIQFIRSANHTNITKGESIVPKKQHVAQEAPGAEVFGTTGLIFLIILIALIVASDFRYFGRVIPICRRRCKSGLHRFNRKFHSQTAEGMQQMVSLTMGLGNMQASGSRAERKATVSSMTSSHQQIKGRKLTVMSMRRNNGDNDDLELGLIRRDRTRDDRGSQINSAYD